ncbi:MAG: magnesium transporter [Bacilli bacterium]|nr:magnesium transporter [Bacilli bacterium]
MEESAIKTIYNEIISLVESDLELLEKRRKIDEYHDYDLAEALMQMSLSQRRLFFECLEYDQIANVISQLDPEDAANVLRETPKRLTQAILNLLQTDDLVDIIDVFQDHDEQVTYLSLVNPKARKLVKEILAYDDSLVGSIMNNNYLEVSASTTIKETIKTIVNMAPKIEFINNIYVLDNGILNGVLSLKEVMSAGNKPTTPISEVMTVNIVSVTPWTEIEDAIDLMKNYDFFLLPVVDRENRMLGVVSYDDIIEALNRESDEDYARLAALSDVVIDAKRETVYQSVRKRLPWLIILLFVNLITSSIITGYESTLAMLPTLAFFMPLILNLAGNTGTQSLGIIIRLFATNQLDTRKAIRKHLMRELFTGIMNGIFVSILLFLLVIAMRSIQGETLADIVPFALVIAMSIAIALSVATVAGALVPLLISVLKIDPAVASGPFITTINDILSLLIYLGLASLMLANYL